MTDIIEVYAQEVAAEEKNLIACNLLKSGVAPEIIANATNLPLEEVLKLAQKQSA